jgi:hypothetical protein
MSTAQAVSKTYRHGSLLTANETSNTPCEWVELDKLIKLRQGGLAFPVPWATNSETSYLATPEDYGQALSGVGFELTKQSNRRDFTIELFNKLRAKTQAKGEPPPLGLHTLMQESTAAKINNMIANIVDNTIAPVELIVQKN